jgi:hypothetical protein
MAIVVVSWKWKYLSSKKNMFNLWIFYLYVFYFYFYLFFLMIISKNKNKNKSMYVLFKTLFQKKNKTTFIFTFIFSVIQSLLRHKVLQCFALNMLCYKLKWSHNFILTYSFKYFYCVIFMFLYNLTFFKIIFH